MKSTAMYHFILARMEKLEKTDNIRSGLGKKQLSLSYIAKENVRLDIHRSTSLSSVKPDIHKKGSSTIIFKTSLFMISKTQAGQMFIRRKMDNEMVVYPYNGTLL